MRLVIREFADDGGDGSNNTVNDVLVIHLREDDTRFIQTEEVDDSDEHWANHFNVWRYNLSDLHRLIVEDSARRRAAWRAKHAAAAAGERAGEVIG